MTWYVTKPCNEATLVWCGGQYWIWEDEALAGGRGAHKARFFPDEAAAREAWDQHVASEHGVEHERTVDVTSRVHRSGQPPRGRHPFGE